MTSRPPLDTLPTQWRLGRMFVCLAITLLLLLGTLVPGAGAQDAGSEDRGQDKFASTDETGAMPIYGGGPAHTGEQPGPAPATAPGEAWTFETGDDFVGAGPVAVSVQDGLVFTGSNAVYAVDLQTGKEAWTYTSESGMGFVAPLALADGVLYAASEDGNVYAFEPDTGDVIWRSELTAMVSVNGGPLVIGDTLFVTSWDMNAYALDTASGDVLWSTPIGGMSTGQPAFANGYLVVAQQPIGNASTSGVIAFKAGSGDLAWTFEIQGKLEMGAQSFMAPAIADGVVYLGGQEGSLLAIDMESGGERWSTTLEAPVSANMAVSDGVVYALVGATILGAYDAATGDELWTVDIESSRLGGVTVSPTEDGETLILVGDGDGTLHAFDENGEAIYTVDVTNAAIGRPVTVIDGVIYVAAMDGSVYALGESSRAATPPSDTDPDVPYADAGMVGPGRYVSPNTDAEVQWDPGTWALDPYMDPPVASDYELDELHLVWETDDVVWIGAYAFPSYGVTMDELIDYSTSPEGIEEIFGPTAEVVLHTSTSPRGAIVLLDTGGFGDWVYYSEFYLVNNGEAFVEMRFAAPVALAEDALADAQEITLNGEPVMTYYPVEDVLDVIEP